MIEHADDLHSTSSVAPPSGAIAELFCTFQGEGPHVGKRHLFLRLGGCTIGCRFCDTPDALKPAQSFEVRGPEAGRVSLLPNPVPAAIAADLVHRFAAVVPPLHAVAVTGGEPLEQVDFLADLLPRLAPLPVLLETAGTLPDALARVIEHVAIVSMDVKLPSVARTVECFDAHRRFLEIAHRPGRSEVYVKVVVNEKVDRAEWTRAIEVVRAVAPAVPFLVQPETTRGGKLAAPFALLAELADEASRAGLADVRVLPQVHKFLGAP